jgi:hypothetical protein
MVADVQIFNKQLGDRVVEAVAAPAGAPGFLINRPHLSSCPCLFSCEYGRLDMMTQVHHNLDCLVMLPIAKRLCCNYLHSQARTHCV